MDEERISLKTLKPSKLSLTLRCVGGTTITAGLTFLTYSLLRKPFSKPEAFWELGDWVSSGCGAISTIMAYVTAIKTISTPLLNKIITIDKKTK